MNEQHRRTYRLGRADLIPPGEGRQFLVEGERVAVFRSRSGELYATQALCPHRQGPLADGLVGGGRVVCPLHSLAFDLSTGRALGGSCSGLRTYRVSLEASGEMRIEVPGQEATEAA